MPTLHILCPPLSCCGGKQSRSTANRRVVERGASVGLIDSRTMHSSIGDAIGDLKNMRKFSYYNKNQMKTLLHGLVVTHAYKRTI